MVGVPAKFLERRDNFEHGNLQFRCGSGPFSPDLSRRRATPRRASAPRSGRRTEAEGAGGGTAAEMQPHRRRPGEVI